MNVTQTKIQQFVDEAGDAKGPVTKMAAALSTLQNGGTPA